MTGTNSSDTFGGGLCAENYGTILRCCARGEVQGVTTAGGLVGDNLGIIVHSYATTNATGGTEAGGLAGTNGLQVVSGTSSRNQTTYEVYGYGYILDCYASGPAIGSKRSGGLVAQNVEKSFIVASYFPCDPNDATQVGRNNGYGTALSERQMKERGSYHDWDFSAVEADASSHAWVMPENGYPLLAWQTQAVHLPYVDRVPEGRARKLLEDAGCIVELAEPDHHQTVPEGCVICTRVATVVSPGQTVHLVLSKGVYNWQGNPGKWHLRQALSNRHAGTVGGDRP